MPSYYFDASALVKRYVDEAGSIWVRDLLTTLSDDLVAMADVTRVEVASALARRAREGVITIAERDALIDTFLTHADDEYSVMAAGRAVIGRAIALVQRHPLRAYDAVQLATAVTLRDSLDAFGLPPLIFVSGDTNLLSAAQAEGLRSEDPNTHP